MRAKRRSDKILLIIAIAALLCGCILLSFFPAARVSERENRILAEFPPLTRTGVSDGSYTAALDTYATERFPLRVPLRTARAMLEIGTGRQEVGGVLLCTDGSLCKRIAVNARMYRKNLTALQNMQASYGDRMTVAVAPRRIDARTEVLPPLYDTDGDTAVWKELSTALPHTVTFPSLTADSHWYRTDHHWTADGAYLAYCQLGKALNFAPYDESNFTKETVSTSFYGTSDAAAGLPFIKPDHITIYRYADDAAYQIKKDGKIAPFTGFYDIAHLQTRDQYAVFFGGNCGILKIESKQELPSLLVIKDSFANAVLPFLARHYNIVAIDPRYHSGGIDEFARSTDRILCLCGMQSLCTASFGL